MKYVNRLHHSMCNLKCHFVASFPSRLGIPTYVGPNPVEGTVWTKLKRAKLLISKTKTRDKHCGPFMRWVIERGPAPNDALQPPFLSRMLCRCVIGQPLRTAIGARQPTPCV